MTYITYNSPVFSIPPPHLTYTHLSLFSLTSPTPFTLDGLMNALQASNVLLYAC